MISIETPKQKPKKNKNRKLYQEEVHIGRTNSSTLKTTMSSSRSISRLVRSCARNQSKRTNFQDRQSKSHFKDAKNDKNGRGNCTSRLENLQEGLQNKMELKTATRHLRIKYMKFEKEMLKSINTGNLETRISHLTAENAKIDPKQHPDIFEQPPEPHIFRIKYMKNLKKRC